MFARNMIGTTRISTKKCAVIVGLCTAVALALVSTGCGGSSMSSNSLSQAQAQAVSNEMVTAVQAALQSAAGSGLPTTRERKSLAVTVNEIRAAQTSGCTITSTGETCNIPVSATEPCPSGGTVGVSGNFDFTLNSSGTGSDSTTLTITPTNCSVDNLTINGNPNLSVAAQINFANDQIAFPATFMETGGITYGPNPSGSCSVNVSLSITSATSCTVTGSVCGRSVNGNC